MRRKKNLLEISGLDTEIYFKNKKELSDQREKYMQRYNIDRNLGAPQIIKNKNFGFE